MDQLADVGIDYDDVIATLEQEGVDKFSKSWQELQDTVSKQMDSSKNA
jgi:transaldolase